MRSQLVRIYRFSPDRAVILKKCCTRIAHRFEAQISLHIFGAQAA